MSEENRAELPIKLAPDIVWRERHSDLCSWCCEPIPEGEVPLLLWRDNGRLMAQFHMKCADPALGLKIQTIEPDEDDCDLYSLDLPND